MAAATLEKANTYFFAEMTIHNPKVGGSIPPPATNNLSELNVTTAEKFVSWAIWGKMGQGMYECRGPSRIARHAFNRK
jgi:hypothetical protein